MIFSTKEPQRFPFLLGRAFIEARDVAVVAKQPQYFPSFWEGLSLRPLVPPYPLQDVEISLPSGKGFH